MSNVQVLNPEAILPKAFNGNIHPIEFLSLFFSVVFLETICTETNKFRSNRKTHSQSPGVGCNLVTDVKVLLGTILNMGFNSKSITEYFSMKLVSRTQFL